MKKIVFLFLVINISLFSQVNKSAIFGDELVWYGVDFSKAKFVGEISNKEGTGQKPEGEIKSKYIPAWNMIVVYEPNKYNVAKFFKKSHVFNDLNPVIKHNEDIDETKITSYNEYKFDKPEETVTQIVASYSAGEKTEGLGLVFIVESYNKTKELGTYYLTFFDIASKQIIYAEKNSEIPAGIGLKNYWASTIYKVMKRVEDSRYYAWKSKFGKEK